MVRTKRGLYAALDNRVIYCKPHGKLQIWIEPDILDKTSCKTEILYSTDEIIVCTMTGPNDDAAVLKMVDIWLTDMLSQCDQALQVLQSPNQNWTDGVYKKRPCHFLQLSKHLRIAMTDTSDDIPWYHQLYLLGKANKILAEPTLVTKREPVADTERRACPLIAKYIQEVRPIYADTKRDLFKNRPPLCAR